MKEKEIEKIEELIQEEKLPKEKKLELKKTIFNNIMECISIIELLVVLMIIAFLPNKQLAIIIYKTTSILALMFSIFLFENAYKKDDGMIAISGIEILVLSIIVLFAPYRFFKNTQSIPWAF